MQPFVYIYRKSQKDCMSQKIAIASFEARAQTYPYAELLHLDLHMQAQCTYAIFGTQFPPPIWVLDHYAHQYVLGHSKAVLHSNTFPQATCI